MTTHESLEERVRRLLSDHDVKIVLDSPDGDYRFEYYTSATKDSKTGEQRYVRAYRLIDRLRGGVTVEPWDTYDLEKQTSFVAGLIDFGRYKLARVIAGWSVACPSCGYVMTGKHWESVPKSCAASSSPKCRQRLDDVALVVKELVVDDAT